MPFMEKPLLRIPFKEMVVGSIPTGGTIKILITLLRNKAHLRDFLCFWFNPNRNRTF